MLVDSIFSFSHNVVYRFKHKFEFFSGNIYFSSANDFDWDLSKILSSGKEWILSQTSPGFSTCHQYNSFENTVGKKKEIARSKQCEKFFLFPQCFQQTCTGDT